MPGLSEHTPDGDWRCKVDGAPWPSCPEARSYVVRSHDADLQALSLWALLELRDAEKLTGQVPQGLAQRCYAVVEEAAVIDSSRRGSARVRSVLSHLDARGNGGR